MRSLETDELFYLRRPGMIAKLGPITEVRVEVN